MRAIKLKSGTVFVKYRNITLRCLDGIWGVSPVTFDTLEWDLGKEGGEEFDYLPAMDLEAALGKDSYLQMQILISQISKILK